MPAKPPKPKRRDEKAQRKGKQSPFIHDDTNNLSNSDEN